jgi:hypothetical protein
MTISALWVLRRNLAVHSGRTDGDQFGEPVNKFDSNFTIII